MPLDSTVPVDVLNTWFTDHGRDLPWRRPGVDAWGVLISEIMLQQTPVARVAPIWSQWLARWPRPSAMAAESPAEVVRAWGKLGYPRRALRLHQCARVIACSYDDTVPSDVTTLLSLPGIGQYTARAIACFAYGQRVPVVDTNVRRVIARAVHGEADAGPPSTTRDLADASAILPSGICDATTFSAAIMELGALVCSARSPRCEDCPIASSCTWHAAGQPPSTAAPKRAQRYEGTDRQVRGKLLDVLRGTSSAVEKPALDLAWPSDPVQRDRALASLLADGLVEQTDEGLFALAGEG